MKYESSSHSITYMTVVCVVLFICIYTQGGVNIVRVIFTLTKYVDDDKI